MYTIKEGDITQDAMNHLRVLGGHGMSVISVTSNELHTSEGTFNRQACAVVVTQSLPGTYSIFDLNSISTRSEFRVHSFGFSFKGNF